jgi:hypothetical protein
MGGLLSRLICGALGSKTVEWSIAETGSPRCNPARRRHMHFISMQSSRTFLGEADRKVMLPLNHAHTGADSWPACWHEQAVEQCTPRVCATCPLTQSSQAAAQGLLALAPCIASKMLVPTMLLRFLRYICMMHACASNVLRQRAHMRVSCTERQLIQHAHPVVLHGCEVPRNWRGVLVNYLHEEWHSHTLLPGCYACCN